MKGEDGTTPTLGAMDSPDIRHTWTGKYSDTNCVFVFVHLYLCIFVFVFVYLYLCIFICVFVFVFVYLYLYLCICICVFDFVYLTQISVLPHGWRLLLICLMLSSGPEAFMLEVTSANTI